MKKIIPFLIFCTMALVLLPSCSKEVATGATYKEVFIDTTIQINSSLRLSLAQFWDSTKTVNIIQQANNFSVSLLSGTENNAAPVYNYSSTLQSGGTDEVILAVSDLDNGKRVITYDSTLIYLSIHIK